MRKLAITEDSLRILVDAFYHRVRAEDMIGPVFNNAVLDWPGHLGKLQAFWSSVMLTSGRYKGQPLPAHIKHAGQINRQSFDRWLMIWGATTADLMDEPSAAALQEKAAKIAESLSLGIEFSRERGRSPGAGQASA